MAQDSTPTTQEPEIIKRTGPHPMQALYDDPVWREQYFNQFTKRELVQILVWRRIIGDPGSTNRQRSLFNPDADE